MIQKILHAIVAKFKGKQMAITTLISLTLYDKVSKSPKGPALFHHDKITAFYRSVIDPNFTVLVTDNGVVWEVVETPDKIKELINTVVLALRH
jgi:hypothetical protein